MKDAFIHVRVTSGLKQKAQEYARETGRTLAGLIEYLLKKELKKGEEKMKTWVVLDYKNGNRTIMEKSEYEKMMRKEYGVVVKLEDSEDEAIVGVVESEIKPTWDDLVYDRETCQYYHIYDICSNGCSWESGSVECLGVDCPFVGKGVK